MANRSVSVGVRQSKRILENESTRKQSLSTCMCVCVSHEPHATHKIQLWKTRNLYSQLTTATHTNICRVQSHLLLQTAQSAPVCVCVSVSRTPHIFPLDINHCPLTVCVCVVSESMCSLWLGMQPVCEQECQSAEILRFIIVRKRRTILTHTIKLITVSTIWGETYKTMQKEGNVKPKAV